VDKVVIKFFVFTFKVNLQYIFIVVKWIRLL